MSSTAWRPERRQGEVPRHRARARGTLGGDQRHPRQPARPGGQGDGARRAGGGSGKRHVLAILPGNRKLDFNAVAAPFEARKCFASPDTAQALTGCVMARSRLSLDPALAIVVDQDLLANDTLFFNAGRLDRSMELDTKDWLVAAAARRQDRRRCLKPGGLAPPSEADFEPLLTLRIEVMREHLERVPLRAGAGAPRFRESFDEPGMRLIMIGEERVGCVGFRIGESAIKLDLLLSGEAPAQ